MKQILFGTFLLLCAFCGPAAAQDSPVQSFPAASALAGTEVMYCEQPSGTDKQCTPAQMAAYVYGLMSADATASGTGAITLKTVNSNVGSFGSTTQCAAITVNAKGLITAISAATCAPAVGSITGFATGIGTWLAAPSSANLLAALTSKTGTGNAVFGSAPTIDSLNATTAMTLAFLTGSTQCLQVNSSGTVSGTGSACGSGGSSGANPTATAGPTAVNGSATTFMRSDGAPAVQTATTSQLGLVQPDGSTIKVASGVISAPPQLTSRTVTGTTDTILSTDLGNIVYYNSASPVAVTQPAPSGAFANGFFTTLCNINTAVATVTPGSGTIGGASTYGLPAGTAPAGTCASYQSDGTNFHIVPSFMINAALLTAGLLPDARLSSNVPLKNGTNVWSGLNTFGQVIGTVTTQSGTTYTFAATDCGTTVRFSNASAVTATIPSALTTNCLLAIEQAGAGKVSVNGSAVTPATLHSLHSYTGTGGQWGIINVFMESSGVAVLTGDGA